MCRINQETFRYLFNDCRFAKDIHSKIINAIFSHEQGILMNDTDYIKLLVDKSAQGDRKISIDIPCSSSYGESKCSTIFTDQAKAESVILEEIQCQRR